MKPTKIFKDGKGWREENPFYKYVTDGVFQGTDSEDWLKFEKAVQYHEFPNAPKVKLGEVVEAMLVWQASRKDTDDWYDIDEDDAEYLSEFGRSFRQIWIQATPTISDVPPIKGVKEAVNLPLEDFAKIRDRFNSGDYDLNDVILRVWDLKSSPSQPVKGQTAELKCVMGCKHYTGGEIKHDTNCPYYADSLSRTFDETSQREIELREENERLKDALNQDKTGLAKGLADVRKILDGYKWICDGRGPYAWNDDKYKAEVLTMLTELDKVAVKALRESGTLATKAIHFKIAKEALNNK